VTSTVKQLLIWVLVIAAGVGLSQFIGKGAGRPSVPTVIYSDLLNQVEDSKVRQVTIDDRTLTGTYADGTEFRAAIPPNDPELYKALESHGVSVTIRDRDSNPRTSFLISIAPFALLLVLWFFLLRQMQAKSKAANPPQNSAR
jgi:cell division protease FtsH